MDSTLNTIPLPEAVADLEKLLNELEEHDRKFADSLINGMYGFKKRGYLTEKQTPHVYRLLEKAMGLTPILPGKPHLGNLQAVYKMFEHAKKHLKWPKVILQAANTPVKIWVQGDQAKVPGALGVMVGASWAGRILQDGTFATSKAFHEYAVKEAVLDLLMAFAKNPAEVAAQYGKMSGNCCFCQSELTDPKSLGVGYGPVCAKNYGLAWGEKELSTAQVVAA